MTNDLSPAEYAAFLREVLPQKLKGTIIFLGTPDDSTSVSIGLVAFNDYSCGLILRPDGGKFIAETEGMASEERSKALLTDQPDNQVVLVFVDPLEAVSFFGEKCLWALSVLAESNGVVSEQTMDNYMADVGAKAHSDLIKLRRASRALVAAVKAQDLEAIAQAQARIEALTGRVD